MLFFSLNSLLLVCSMHMLNPKSGSLGFKQSLNTFLSGSITKWTFGKPNTHVHRRALRINMGWSSEWGEASAIWEL